MWDECLDHSYYPFISYRYGWLKAYEAGRPHLSALFVGQQKDDHGFEYVCPLYIDRKHRELTSAVGVFPGFINRNVNPDEMLSYLIMVAKREGLGRISLQIPPGYGYCNNLIKKGFELKRKISFFILPITDYPTFEDYLGSLTNKGKKSDIKFALKAGLTISAEAYTPEIYRRFETFLHEMAARKNAELPGERFYAALSDYYPHDAIYWIAIHDGVDVGSALTFVCQDHFWIMWLQGGERYRNLKVDTFLYAEIIRYAIFKQFSVVNFGTSPADTPLADFKRRLGADLEFHELYELDLALSFIAKKTLRYLKHYLRAKYAD